MSQISAAAVNELRKRTDQPLMDCKSALVEAAGDMDKAIDILRSRNSKIGVKRGGNETAEGRVSVYVDPAAQTAAIVEVRCESAPSAKADQFLALGTDLAKQVAVTDPQTVEELVAQPFVGGTGTVTDRINEVIGLIRENMKPHRFVRKAGGQFGGYVHHDGTVGVLVQAKGDKPNDEVLRDVGAHIAAMNPPYLTADQVPADVVAKEKEIALKQIQEDPKNVGKPANILEKIAEGKLKTYFAETVLVEQPIANQMKYDKKTVGQVLKAAGLEPVAFVRYKVGEVTG